jgi:predicted PurR-regulated permease PerM
VKYRHDTKYLHWGVTAFCVIAAGIACAVIIFNLGLVLDGIQKVLSILSPVLYGLGIAYLLNPIVRFVENHLKPRLATRFSRPMARKTSRITGILVAFAVLGLVLYLLFSMLVPQLVDSLRTIIRNLSNYYAKVEGWIMAILEDNPDMGVYANAAMDKLYAWVMDFLENDLLPRVQTMMLGLTTSVINLVKWVVNLVVGLVVSVYVLFNKDIFLAQAKKMTVAFWKPGHADYLMELASRADHIFGGFIRGKLVDSLIIGVLCYAGMRIIGLPFPVLVSAIVGVTNIIPFFGPYIGAIPSTFLILVVDPLQGLYFLIFVLVLQQVDGNIIGPRILGDATGLTGFWVVVAITFFGGLFGFAGMILGVPVFAMLYMLLGELVNHFLRQKGCSTDTRDYYPIQTVEDLTPPDEQAPPTETPDAPAN